MNTLHYKSTVSRILPSGVLYGTGVALAGSLLAFFVGAALALMGGVFPAIAFTVGGLGLLVLFNYHLGVWLLVLLLPFAATYLIPRQVLGITGLNPVNVLLAATLVGLAAAYVFQRGRVALVPLPKILLLYLAVLAFATFMGSFKAESAILQLNP